MKSLALLAIAAFFSCTAMMTAAGNALAIDYEVTNERSLGKQALDYRHTGLFDTSTNTVLVDGSVTSLGTDATTYDRTLVNITYLGGAFALAPRVGLRLGMLANLNIRNEEGAEEPRKVSRETWLEARPEATIVFFTQNSLEINLGLQYFVQPGFERKTETTTIDTVTSYSETTMPLPFIAVVKRTGAFEGGFYYFQGAERGRTVKKYTTQDGTELSFRESVHVPPELAIFFQAGVLNFKLFGEFAAVQASEGGNITDTGDPTTEDYQRIKLSALFPIEPATFNIRSTLIHKTLSYADNQNVSLPTIPMTALHLHFINGSEERHGYVGLIIATGKDGQSLDEFNASYEVGAYGVAAGINLSL